MSSDLTDLYNKLLERSKELAVIGSAGAILSWDMETKMPPGAVELKSQQLAFIQKVGHQRLTDPENGRILDAIEKNPGYGGLTQLQ
jgi:carboxypeptidase Taq